MDTTTVLTSLQKKIEKLKAETQAKLDKEIAQLENIEKANDARKVLKKNIDAQIKNFETKYSVKYFIDGENPENKAVSKLNVVDKCKLIDAEKIDGKAKYKLSEDGKGVIGAGGNKITSIIKFDDADGKKQTLGVANYFKYLKPETTKQQLNQLYPNLERKK